MRGSGKFNSSNLAVRKQASGPCATAGILFLQIALYETGGEWAMRGSGKLTSSNLAV